MLLLTNVNQNTEDAKAQLVSSVNSLVKDEKSQKENKNHGFNVWRTVQG